MWASDSMLWHWLAGLTLIVAGSIAVFWGLFARKWTHDPRRRCPKCAYDLSATPGLKCPECGRTAKDEHRLFRKRRQWWVGMLGLIAIAGGLVAMVRPLGDVTTIRLVPPRLMLALWRHGISDRIWSTSFNDWAADALEREAEIGPSPEARQRTLAAAALHRLTTQPQSPHMAFTWQIASKWAPLDSKFEQIALATLASSSGEVRLAVCAGLYNRGFSLVQTADALMSVLQSRAADDQTRSFAAIAIARQLSDFPHLREAWSDAIEGIKDETYFEQMASNVLDSDARFVARRKVGSSDHSQVLTGIRWLNYHPDVVPVCLSPLVDTALTRDHAASSRAKELLMSTSASIDHALVVASLKRPARESVELLSLLAQRGPSAVAALPALRKVSTDTAIDEVVREAASWAIVSIERAVRDNATPIAK